MTGTNLRFYEELAAHCHLICDDWNEAIERQAQVLGPLIHSHANGNCLRVFDVMPIKCFGTPFSAGVLSRLGSPLDVGCAQQFWSHFVRE
jgi:hypothetical protein